MAATALLGRGQSKAYVEAFEKVDRAVAKENWAEAEAALLEALQRDPDNEVSWMVISNLGMMQYYQGKDSLALATLATGLQSYPRSITMLANRARILTDTGKIARALDDYDTILSIDSLNADAYLNRGLLNLYFGDLEQARRDIDKRLELRPDNSESWLAGATLFTILEEPAQALPYYNRLILEHPTSGYYAGRAFCLLATEHYADAADDIAAGLELDPENPELYLCRAILHKLRYENDEALTDAQRAISYGADPNRVRQILGFCSAASAK